MHIIWTCSYRDECGPEMVSELLLDVFISTILPHWSVWMVLEAVRWTRIQPVSGNVHLFHDLLCISFRNSFPKVIVSVDVCSRWSRVLHGHVHRPRLFSDCVYGRVPSSGCCCCCRSGGFPGCLDTLCRQQRSISDTVSVDRLKPSVQVDILMTPSACWCSPLNSIANRPVNSLHKAVIFDNRGLEETRQGQRMKNLSSILYRVLSPMRLLRKLDWFLIGSCII